MHKTSLHRARDGAARNGIDGAAHGIFLLLVKGLEIKRDVDY